MRYFIEITRTEPPEFGSELGMPTDQLPTAYDDVESAAEAAFEFIQASGLPPGSMTYNIVDEDGRTAVTGGESAP